MGKLCNQSIEVTINSDEYYYATLYGYIVATDSTSKYYTYTIRFTESGMVAWDFQNGMWIC